VGGEVDGGEVGKEDGEGLLLAVFAGAEESDGGGVGGIGEELETADAFEGEDLAGAEPRRGARD
jgi:hypothetical protein